jgi:hypothetical protein
MMTYCRTSDFFRGTDFALGFRPSISRLARPKDLGQLLRRIYDYVRNRLLEGMRSEPIGHAYRPQPGIATSTDIDVRITNNRGVLWLHAVFFQQFSRSLRIRLLRAETIAAVNLGEEWIQA